MMMVGIYVPPLPLNSPFFHIDIDSACRKRHDDDLVCFSGRNLPVLETHVKSVFIQTISLKISRKLRF
jgi:hypothetical protein